MSQPLVSVVLVTRNGAATLPEVLDALAHQRTESPIEIVAVDSSSDDGTVDLLRGRVHRLISIAADSFDHGLTRNLGIEQSTGDLIVLLVQDAVPVSRSWLANLTAPLAADTRLAGSFARQKPRPDASAITRHYLESWAGTSHTPWTAEIGGGPALQTLQPPERLTRCTFDNVCSCIRRSVWLEHPFRSTPIGEDLEWARDVLLAGYRLAYVPTAEVVHSHDRPALYEFARTYALHRRLYELFALRTIPTVPLLWKAIASSLAVHWRCQRNGPRVSSARAAALALAWPLGQYLGGLSAARGWRPLKLQRV